MITLPEKMRRTLEKIVKTMRVEENVYGVGLFGSWSRGDAEASSDVDLFILDKGNFGDEYVERVEVGGLPVDLDRVPHQSLRGPIPAEIDQKLHEMQILYDRDWSLTNTKLLMARSYSSPERVDIRTEAHVVQSDIYLSRATSAFSREDFQSAQLFGVLALENILKVLIEVTLEPFSNSRFLERLEASAEKLALHSLFNEYLAISGLNKTDDVKAKAKLKTFRTIWDEINAATRQNPRLLESAHFKVKAKLNYYLSPAFLQGMIVRTASLVDSGRFVEASHYLNNVVIDLVENYVWLKSSKDRIRVDYTTLMRSLKSVDDKNHMRTAEFLGLVEADKPKVSDTIERSRGIIVKIRMDRKALIKNRSLKS